MDPSKSHNKAKEDNLEADNQDPPAIVTLSEGEMRIQLEGSHTTDTETEEKDLKECKNLKFKDDETKVHEIPQETGSSNQNPLEKVTQDSQFSKDDFQTSLRSEELITNLHKFQRFEKVKHQKQERQPELQQIGRANENIAEKFQQIMEMFETFTKNLESLDLTATPPTSQGNVDKKVAEPRPKHEKVNLLQQPRQHKSRYEDHYQQQEKETERIPESIESKAFVEKRSVSTDMSTMELASYDKTTQNLACQTSFQENVNSFDSSLAKSTSSTAGNKTEVPSPLNNCADAARADHTGLQPLAKENKPNKSETVRNPAVLTLTVPGTNPSTPLQQEHNDTPMHTINIHDTTTPLSANNDHPSSCCQRFGTCIRNFFASIFQCLHASRDVILFVFFFVAFVMSASFMTAFFYETLSMNPSMQEPSVSEGRDIINRYKIAGSRNF